MNATIVFTGGGTSGHVTKNIAVIEELKKNHPAINIEYVGSGSKLETDLLSKMNIPYHTVSTGKLRRYFSFRNITDIFGMIKGIIQSAKLLKKIKPNVVFSSGGFVALPVCVAAQQQKIPVITHESDAVPGLANKCMAKLANKICISFQTGKRFFPQEKTVLTGNPVRSELLKGNKQSGYRFTNFLSGKKIVLVMGGSQGAQKINELLTRILPELLKKTQVIHITGKDKKTDIVNNSYKQYEFVDAKDLANLYQIADIVVSRAGAASINEILANQKPCILIPLSTAASNHQFLNAEATQKQGCAKVLDEKTLTPDELSRTILELLNNKVEQNNMVENAKQIPVTHAAQKIVEIIDSIIVAQ